MFSTAGVVARWERRYGVIQSGHRTAAVVLGAVVTATSFTDSARIGWSGFPGHHERR